MSKYALICPNIFMSEANFLPTWFFPVQSRGCVCCLTHAREFHDSELTQRGGRLGSWLSPYHVHDCENVRGDVGLAVLLHHLLVCHHKGFHVEALLWLASWPSGPSRAPIFIEPEIGVLCGRLRGICKEQKSIWKGRQQRPAGETDRHLNQGRRETRKEHFTRLLADDAAAPVLGFGPNLWSRETLSVEGAMGGQANGLSNSKVLSKESKKSSYNSSWKRGSRKISIVGRIFTNIQRAFYFIA